jgi:hypothetical protein
MFNKDRFHNQLALALGCKRIIRDCRYDINVEYLEHDIPIVRITGPDNLKIEYNPTEEGDTSKTLDLDPELKEIIEAVHKAYIDSSKELFSPYIK